MKLAKVAVACEPRRDIPGPLGFRQRLERAAAANYSVPLLARFDARAPRYDMHPGREHHAPGFLDCMHSSFERGLFEPEAFGLLHALEHRLQHARRQEGNGRLRPLVS